MILDLVFFLFNSNILTCAIRSVVENDTRSSGLDAKGEPMAPGQEKFPKTALGQ